MGDTTSGCAALARATGAPAADGIDEGRVQLAAPIASATASAARLHLRALRAACTSECNVDEVEQRTRVSCVGFGGEGRTTPDRQAARPAARRQRKGTTSAPRASSLAASVSVPVQFKTSGCLFSIVASVVLTIVLNLLLRSCAS
jgi:hypothetical protein